MEGEQEKEVKVVKGQSISFGCRREREREREGGVMKG